MVPYTQTQPQTDPGCGKAQVALCDVIRRMELSESSGAVIGHWDAFLGILMLGFPALVQHEWTRALRPLVTVHFPHWLA